MKFLRDFLRIFAVVLAVATLATFFLNYAHVTCNKVGTETTAAKVTESSASSVDETADEAEDSEAVEANGDSETETTPAETKTVDLTGAELVFGSDKSADLGFSDGTMTTYKSGWIFLSFFLSIFTALFMILGLFKKNGWNGAALITGIINSILLFLFAFSKASSYIDIGHLSATDGGVVFTGLVLIAAILSVAAILVCVAGVLVKDHIEVVASNGAKLSIPAKIMKFLREYKSELKKIVWPTGRSVVKNTIVVLVMCLVVLLIIWLVDWGCGELFKVTFAGSSSAASSAASAVSNVASVVSGS